MTTRAKRHRVVLAYSGGLEATAAIPWLLEWDVVTAWRPCRLELKMALKVVRPCAPQRAGRAADNPSQPPRAEVASAQRIGT